MLEDVTADEDIKSGRALYYWHVPLFLTYGYTQLVERTELFFFLSRRPPEPRSE